MDENDLLAVQFEANRDHLRAVAYRMLGSLSEADDAVQEAWVRLSRSDTSAVENLGGWLTTVVARVCLDGLRTRQSRREDPLDERVDATLAGGPDPEQEAQLADSVGLALLVVLETLAPAERLAFVLHDLFALPFDEIAPVVGRSPAAARQLASRARRRVQGGTATPDLTRQREVVEAFLAASRGGDLDGLVALLDPDVVRHADPQVLPPGEATEVRGPRVVATHAMAGRSSRSEIALVEGSVGIVVAPRGRLQVVLRFTFADDRITAIDVIGDPARLAALEVAVLA